MKPEKMITERHTLPIRNTLTALAVGLAIGLATLLTARPAAAVEFTFHAEPAALFFLDDPQTTHFLPGFYMAVRPGISLGRVVALQWSYAVLLAPPKSEYDFGVAHFLMAGIRVRPFATLRPPKEQLGGFFVDFNLGYVRTGELDRFGFDAGLGYGFQVAKTFSLGPVVRYGHIVQPENNLNEDGGDAHFITVGLDLAFGPAYKEPKAETEMECTAQECTAQECPAARECPVAVEPVPVVADCRGTCPDHDGDGVCDSIDRCPTQKGPADTFGCPTDPCSGSPIVVLVQFNYDSSQLPPPKDSAIEMDPVLDAVAKAIAQDKSCRVCIVGNASLEGPDDYNMELSKRRATAVQGYLTKRGVKKSAIPTTGLGEACQLIPETSRELNRRVEFRRLLDDGSCPTDCTP